MIEGPSARCMPALRLRLATITPDEAAALLQRRRPSTRTNAAAIRSYAEAMRAGRWLLNGMPVILSQHGMLLDGLQRLAACVEAAVPFPTFVAENVTDDVLHTIDQQRRRSFAGVLEARGVRHAHAVQAALVKLLHYDDATLDRAAAAPCAAPSWARMDRALAANPDLEAIVAESLKTTDTTLPEPVRTPLLFMGRRADPAAIARLLTVVADADRHPVTEPGVLLRHELDRGREEAGVRPAPVRLLALAIIALNATAQGTSLRRLGWTPDAPDRPGDPFPRLLGYAGLGDTTPAPVTPLPPEAENIAEVSCRIESIDAARAEAYLRHNTRNRRVMPAHVTSIARDIVAGRWMLNAQPICFARDGLLLNGQHRLMAVILADGVIEVPVIRGLPPAAEATYDLHAKRSPEFGTALESFGDRALVSAMANLLWRRELRPPGARHTKATASEIKAIVADHPRLLELRSFGRKMVDHGRASVMGYGAYAIERSDPQRGPEFLRALESGADLPAGHPILMLRRQLQRLRRDKAPQEDQLAALLGGWERFRNRPIR
jgi:hypothetical protein